MRTCLSIALLFLLGSCTSKAYLFTSFREPANEGLRMLYSYDGYHWERIDTILLKPSVGKDKIMRDPSMIEGPDGVFHLVWTTEWKGGNGFGYARSNDLLHWEDIKYFSAMMFDPFESKIEPVKSNVVNVWAPELFYDNEKSEYIIVWASCLPGKFEKGIEDENNNHRLYYTTTKDFVAFTETKLFFDPGFSVIDAVIVKRAARDYILILKDNTRPERDIKVAFGETPLGPWKNPSKAFTENFTEGPSVVKVNNEWLIYYDSYQKKTYEASATKDFIRFENITGKVIVPAGHKHGTIVAVKRKFVKHLLKQLEP
ncbi:MAG: glycoside hydrolase family 43 protein [Chitinophagaceae bacterium]|nr:glycoside hydrolase family 43 protein [Chitinophagaceae bacterium]